MLREDILGYAFTSLVLGVMPLIVLVRGGKWLRRKLLLREVLVKVLAEMIIVVPVVTLVFSVWIISSQGENDWIVPITNLMASFVLTGLATLLLLIIGGYLWVRVFGKRDREAFPDRPLINKWLALISYIGAILLGFSAFMASIELWLEEESEMYGFLLLYIAAFIVTAIALSIPAVYFLIKRLNKSVMNMWFAGALGVAVLFPIIVTATWLVPKLLMGFNASRLTAKAIEQENSILCDSIKPYELAEDCKAKVLLSKSGLFTEGEIIQEKFVDNFYMDIRQMKDREKCQFIYDLGDRERCEDYDSF